MITQGKAVLYCAFDAWDSEPRWVVEVVGMDGEIDQRLAACDDCADATFEEMRRGYPQAENGAYSVIRRLIPTDSILEFGSLALGEED